MSFDQLQKLVGSLSKTVDSQEKIAIPLLKVKLAKCLEMYPHDQTIGSMHRVVEQLSFNNNIFIRKAELQNLYKRLHSRNTKFAELFQEELGQTDQLPTPTLYQRDSNTSQVEINNTGDAVLANALESVFDKNMPVKLYSKDLANKAQKLVLSMLDGINLKPNAISVANGSDKFIIVKADYDTPKGITSFYVPVETKDNKALNPSLFMGNAGPQEIDHNTVKKYVTSFAGNKLNVNAEAIVSVLNKAASENTEISSAELALANLKASRLNKEQFFANQITGQKIDDVVRGDVKLAKSNEFESFEKQFSSPLGVANLTFGKEKVASGRESVVRDLLDFGFANAQVTVTNSDKSTIFYGISLDAGATAFVVPFKLVNGKLIKPSVLICNGSVIPFDKSGINKLYSEKQSDYKIAAAASPQFGLKPADLIQNIRNAMVSGNHSLAEDALNVLHQMGDAKIYAYAFNVYKECLSGEFSKEAESTCSMIIKNAKNSQHPMCAHTNLPINKVYQDKDGNCRPLYRRDIDETYQGAYFMNAKILG